MTLMIVFMEVQLSVTSLTAPGTFTIYSYSSTDNFSTFFRSLGALVQDKPIPSLSSQFFYRVESVFPSLTTVAETYVWYDGPLKLFRYDTRSPPQQEITTIHDFNTGVAYKINQVTQECTISGISKDEPDIAKLSSTSNSIPHTLALKSALDLLLIDGSYKFIDKDGKTLTENEEISNRWKEYCSEMYEDNTNEERKQVESNDEILEPTRSKVEWAIKQLPKGKSAGNDEIHAEMIKASGEQGIDIFHKLCKKIWIEEKWPDEWVKSVFVPIPKKGDLQQCSNYRTIALITHASKILLKIIMKMLEKKIEEEVSQTQAGFRRNRGTRDQIF
ncbi:endonuclease-reverse transcriptase [Elysia marginata]|uniref:Endonuclease-reverse transcriptase n=1 Tax=Elysia marginata TaxID=1093978 RepID=A0AAV4HIY8_9GAST|nr:endonuclease-reverse transcriptase [Elysia marginata]